MTTGIDTSKELTRSDAIRLWQDAKAAAGTAADERDKALKRCNELANEIKTLNQMLTAEKEARKAAEGQITAADGRTKAAQETIEKLEHQLKQTRDYKGVNARLLARLYGQEQANKVLKQKVASLQSHDFQADLEKTRNDLKAEKFGREADSTRAAVREEVLKVEVAEKSTEIATLTKRVKELTEQVEHLQPKKETSV